MTDRNYEYPPAKEGNVVDDYHGTKVADPYRWLENADDVETIAWVEKQNEITREFLATSERGRIIEKLTALWDYPKYGSPFKRGGRYFFFKNDGLQNQAVLYVQETLESEPKTVIDPNTFSKDGTIALGTFSISEDSKYIAYGTSSGGTDWLEWKIREIDSGKELGDRLVHTRFTNMAWKHDNSGMYYTRFPDPATVKPGESTLDAKVYYHELGTRQEKDILVYERPDNRRLGFGTFITDDGKYLVASIWQGTDNNNYLHYREVESDGEFVSLLDDFDASYSLIDNIGTTFYIQTDKDAPRGRIIAIDIENPAPENWKTVIPECDDSLHFSAMINDKLVVAYMHHAAHQLKIFETDGTQAGEIELPTIGSIVGMSGKRKDSEMFISFTSFVYPTTIFRYDFETSELSTFRKSEIDFDPSGYETKQVFAESKDGTKIPIFITHKKGITLDGNNPVLLNGYGGFGVSRTPGFMISRLIWLKAGGVFALAVLRGGKEYGEEWHKAAMLEKKQNVFDDFIAAGEWLIENKYTSNSRLAISGGSNGGLLVGACMIQRPELYGAVICAVPVLDMLRYHKYTVGKFWVGEYGDAEENPEHFRFLYEYSPLHNVKDGETHPPTLIMSADTDDRVAPAHAKKFAATLQKADSGKNPILLRIEMKAGHGHGKPTTKLIEEISDIDAFLFRIFGMSPK
ncbi:MAG: prolyl oligopeptidase family serine peptidase [Planctomycetota bacterium]|jgi:prolyl oligopeptidase